MRPKVFRAVEDMQAWSRERRRESKVIGLVPTMGALHEGHLSLMRAARSECDAVVVSIFVNPTQFGPGEDYKKYPKRFPKDVKACEAIPVDAVFAPKAEDYYPPGFSTAVEVGGTLTNSLCGITRPGHFRGVTTVVAKLFNSVLPHRAYFGEKDAQQLRVLRRMAGDLSFPIEIIGCPIVREADGLAVSSRNEYLSADERKRALFLHEAVEHCKERVAEGERDATKLLSEMSEIISRAPDAEIDYVSIVDSNTLEDVRELSGEVLAAVAVRIGRTRLIDNATIVVPEK